MGHHLSMAMVADMWFSRKAVHTTVKVVKTQILTTQMVGGHYLWKSLQVTMKVDVK